MALFNLARTRLSSRGFLFSQSMLINNTPSQRIVTRSLSSNPPIGKATYDGPYTEDQVHELEKFAFEVQRNHKPAKKLVDPWLRTKLGPYYRDFWQQRVASRDEEAKMKEREQARPPVSTHFTVTHPSPENEAKSESENVFAVIGLSGTQYKVTAGDVVICNKLPGAEVGTKIALTDVLLVGSPSKTLVGRPNVPNYEVIAFVEQQAKEKKQLAFYKKPKTYSQKVRGFRREVTILRIASISSTDQEAKSNTTTETTQT